MPVVNSANVAAAFKKVYAESLKNYLPAASYFCKQTKLTPQKLGEKHVVTLQARMAHSYSVGGVNDGAFALDPFRGSAVIQGEVGANTHIVREAISNDSLFRCMNGDKASFIQGTAPYVNMLMKSAVMYCETAMLHGWSIGRIASAGGGDATTAVLTFEPGEFAAGIWGALEGAGIEARLTSNLNTLVSSGADAIFTVSNVNASAETVTVTGTSTGITAIKAIAAPHDVGFSGKFGKLQPSLFEQAGNTGTIFGLNANTHSVARGNTHVTSGTLTRESIEEAVTKATDRGLVGDVVCLLAHKQFGKLAANEAAYRRHGADAEGAKNGFKKLEFLNSSGGVTKVMPYIYCKPSQALIFPEESLVRTGAADFQFGDPGSDNGFSTLPDNAGVQLRVGWNMTLYTTAMAHSVVMSGFTV